MKLSRGHDNLWLATLCLAHFDAVSIISGHTLPGMGEMSVARLAFMASLVATAGILAARPAMRRTTLAVSAPMTVWALWMFLRGAASDGGEMEARYLLRVAVYAIMVLAAGRLSLRREDAAVLYYLPLLAALALGVVELTTGQRLSASRQHDFAYAITGPFANTLYFAFFLGLYIPGTLYGALVLKGRWRMVHGALTVIAALMLVMTGSRTGLIGVGVGVSVAVVIAGRQLGWRLGRTLIVAVGLITAGAPMVVDRLSRHSAPELIEKLRSTQEILDVRNSLFWRSSRAYVLAEGLEHFKERPILGFGPAAAEDLLGADPWAARQGNTNAHNWWLELLLNGGLVGVMLFGLLLVRTARRLFPLDPRSVGDHGWPVPRGSLVSGLVAFPILAFGPSSLLNIATPWIFIGICCGLGVREPENPGDARSSGQARHGPDWAAGSPPSHVAYGNATYLAR